MVEPFMILEEKFTTCLDNPTSSERTPVARLEKNLTNSDMTLTKTCKGSMTDTPLWRCLVRESIKSV